MSLLRMLIGVCVLAGCGSAMTSQPSTAAEAPAQTHSDPAEFVAGTNLNEVDPFEKYAGWKLLFDGQTTDGWRNYKQDGIDQGWEVINGALVRAKRVPEISSLVSSTTTSNFSSTSRSRPAGTAGSCFA